MTSAPSVPDFLAGYGPQQADMTTLVTTPMTFFQQRVVLRVRQTSAATTLPSSGALTAITFNTVDEDPYSGWSASNHNYTPPYAGLYQVTLTVAGAGNGSTGVVLIPALFVDGTATNDMAGIVVGTGAGGAESTTLVPAVGGDTTIQGAAKVQNAASNYALSVAAVGQQSCMEIVWILGA